MAVRSSAIHCASIRYITRIVSGNDIGITKDAFQNPESPLIQWIRDSDNEQTTIVGEKIMGTQNQSNPQTDERSDEPTSQLPDLTPSQPIEAQREPDSANVKVIDSPLEHQLLEMESKVSHELGTMQSKIDSEFSGLREDISDFNDSMKESMDRLENTVDRFTSTVKWYIVIAGGTAVLVIALLLWNAFFN